MLSVQRWFLATFGTLLLLLAIRRLRTYRLKERYALLFLLWWLTPEQRAEASQHQQQSTRPIDAVGVAA